MHTYPSLFCTSFFLLLAIFALGKPYLGIGETTFSHCEVISTSYRRKYQGLHNSHIEKDTFTDSRSLSTCYGTLRYLGGLVLPNVKVITIFWGGADYVPYASEYNTFYSAITNSAWMKVFSEYNTPTAAFGMGSLLATYSYVNGTKSGLIIDTDIPGVITKLINGGFVPPPDSNTYYAVHFPINVTVKSGTLFSCQQYCAYHDSFSFGSSWIAYGIMPTCNAQCGKDPILLNNLYSVASHELAEAITNPNRYGWYNSKCGEIGDMCNHEHDTTLGSNGQRYMIQKQWSNQRYNCIGNGPTPSPFVIPSSSPSTTHSPTISKKPSTSPAYLPTNVPTISVRPTSSPSLRRSKVPTKQPINKPSRAPSQRPSRKSTRKPTTRKPTSKPFRIPTRRRPTRRPSRRKTFKPTPRRPSKRPSLVRPSKRPSKKPSLYPMKYVT